MGRSWPTFRTLPSSAERARLDELRVVAQEDRATVELALGRHAAMVAELEQLVAIHPFREGLRGLLMLALYRSGRQAEALQHIGTPAGRCVTSSVSIQARSYASSRTASCGSHRNWTGRPPGCRSAFSPWRRRIRPCRRRRRQRISRSGAAARRAAGCAHRGRGWGRPVVLVAGEPGIGKTRLAEEVAQQATRGGVAVAWGRCSEEQGAPPFWPWVQVLRELLAEVPERLRPSWAPRDRADSARSRAGRGHGSGRILAVLDVEAVRFRLCQAAASLLRRLASARTLLLIVDDLQWADAASLRLLSTLTSALRGSRVLVVGTYRSHDADGGGRLPHTLAVLARESAVDRISLVLPCSGRSDDHR